MNVRFGARLSAVVALATVGAAAWAQTPVVPQTGTETKLVEAPVVQPTQPATAARKLDLVAFATKEDLKRLATKEDLKQYARKADVDALRADLERMLAQIRAIRARLAEPSQPTPASQTTTQTNQPAPAKP